MKLILGSAQFGLDYGVTNHGGQVGTGSVQAILSVAREHGISVIDTAVGYGQSEKILGQLDVSSQGFSLSTKIPAGTPAREYERVARASVDRLGVKSLDTLWLHDGRDLLSVNGGQYYEALQALKDASLCRRIGASLYDDSDCARILQRYDLDVIQAPVNLLDQRFISEQLAALFAKTDTSLQARSVFLQGTLLENPKNLPEYFSPWKQNFSDINQTASAYGVGPMRLCFSVFSKAPHIEAAVVGCCEVNQLNDILRANRQSPLAVDVRRFAHSDLDLILPTRWEAVA